jgi:hypothetical protein
MRPVGVGLVLLGVVGLGLAAVPTCVGGGGIGENVVHLEGSGAALAIGVAGGGVHEDRAPVGV